MPSAVLRAINLLAKTYPMQFRPTAQFTILVSAHLFFKADASCLWSAGSGGYANDNLHPAVTGSQPSACTVEPGSASDVGEIVNRVIVSVDCHAHCRCSCKY